MSANKQYTETTNEFEFNRLNLDLFNQFFEYLTKYFNDFSALKLDDNLQITDYEVEVVK